MKEDIQNYVPEPIDLSVVELPDSLVDVAEQIARNVHEVWAKGRMDEGWTYGVERDDKCKKHPCLVPYEALPESEKEYDRRTAMNAIRMLRYLGYRIEKKEE